MKAFLWTVMALEVLALLTKVWRSARLDYPIVRTATATDDLVGAVINCAFIAWVAWLLWGAS